MKGMQGGMAQLMKQANQMQMKMKKAQEELAKKEYEATSGGGAVKVKVNGDHMITALTIDAEVLKAGDVEMLQDMILSATNEAIKTAKDTSSKEMEKITGGLNIPGMF
ncbi:YbaB/EbfC family nucleoid-associated protein [Bdellovibrio bacteriovorus]|uniref:Nucleoid-associated protein AZI85_01735 n=1 Tax=Bdellovibrio bacteriovorus TaxID=959 RepID=A0A150WW65_BDEBC|nr:YbaB/EbfC family nucleoid-associated protein [Bdellovibrio bacteriovorus]KYG68786.1 nucleoid-associated protein [Bdellovibrio bacteriovorus]KYG70679.1 nucleoid-associated protein [Bdellovibrio bacteriovorus]